ncbi:protein kinase domain-containing protein [Actinosynnema sp. NPDC004786]
MESGGTGTVGGRYALVERIGSGAMGVVWRARDGLLDREVAVKQLRWPDLTDDEVEVARARAMREARNAARLQHPDAISLFDVVVEDGRPWLVMEHLPSRSLAGLLAEEGGLDPVEAARVGGRVASALAAAHAAGIVHRDVKPSNVLIGHDGTVKLTDFGISRAAGDGTLTDSGMITGTPAYLAPEVARGEQPDRASDVFSLGATLYAAVEGKSPHGVSDNNFGLLYRAAAGRVEPPTRCGPLTGVLERLLAADPAERPTAAQAVELLAEIGRADGRERAERDSAARKAGDADFSGQGAGERAAAPGSRPQNATGDARDSDQGVPAERASAEPGPAVERAAKRRWLAPVVAALMLVVVAGVVAVLALRPWSPEDTAAPPTTFTTENAIALVSYHYALLPEDPEAAWHNLSTSYRQQPFEEYRAFWGQYDDVRADPIEAVQDHPTRFVVRVRVTFLRGATEVSGSYQLVLEQVEDRLLISESQQLA